MGIAIIIYVFLALLTIVQGDPDQKIIGWLMILVPVSVLVYALVSGGKSKKPHYRHTGDNSSSSYSSPSSVKKPRRCDSELNTWKKVDRRVYFGDGEVWYSGDYSDTLIGYYYDGKVYDYKGKREGFFDNMYNEDSLVAVIRNNEIYTPFAGRTSQYKPEEMYGYAKSNKNIYKKQIIGEGSSVASFEYSSESEGALAAAYLSGILN